jgi:hypothetical protein
MPAEAVDMKPAFFRKTGVLPKSLGNMKGEASGNPSRGVMKAEHE